VPAAAILPYRFGHFRLTRSFIRSGIPGAFRAKWRVFQRSFWACTSSLSHGFSPR
jgi:hypothetical protein